MTHINTEDLRYDSSRILGLLEEKNGKTYVKETIKIVIPDRYVSRNLAFFNDTVKTVGIYAILDSKGNYCTFILPLFQDIHVSLVEEATFSDGKLYKMLVVEEGNLLLDNTLVVTDSTIGDISDEFYIKGNIPWFIDYNMLPTIFTESKYYCHNNIGNDRNMFEILTSMLARDSEDKTTYLRHSKNPDPKLAWVGLNNIYTSYKNTGSKLIGSYYGYGVTAAIINPEVEASKLEKALIE